MANITSTDKVLHIGCGTIPSESMIIAERTKARVVGIDNNKNAVKFAKKIVEKKGLSDLIKIEYCDGEEYPVQDFDVIVVAINVWPIEKVLIHLSKQMKKDARIICKGMKEGIIDCIEKSNLSDILYVKSVTPTPKMQSLLIVKKS